MCYCSISHRQGQRALPKRRAFSLCILSQENSAIIKYFHICYLWMQSVDVANNKKICISRVPAGRSGEWHLVTRPVFVFALPRQPAFDLTVLMQCVACGRKFEGAHARGRCSKDQIKCGFERERFVGLVEKSVPAAATRQLCSPRRALRHCFNSVRVCVDAPPVVGSHVGVLEHGEAREPVASL